MNDPGARFLHLNRDGRWPGFAWRGLVADAEGSLTLAGLPRLDSDAALRSRLAASPAPDGPAGLAVAPDGSVLWSDPAAGVVMRRAGCDGHVGPVPLPPDAGPLGEPRALAIHPGRNALLVADAARDQVLAFSLDDDQLVAVWGGSGNDPGQLDRPLALAVGAAGEVFVADFGNGRIQKLTPGGTPDPAFAAAVAAAAPDLARPVALSWSEKRLFVLDRGAQPTPSTLYAFAADGSLHGQYQISAGEPLGLLALGDAVYLGDNTARRLDRLTAEGDRLGSAAGFSGPVAALAGDGDGLWLHPGGEGAPLRLARHGAFLRHGVLWGGPVEVDGQPHRWHRLAVRGELPDTVAVSLFASPGIGGPPPPPDPAGLDTPGGGFDPAVWTLLAPGVADALVGTSSQRLWVAALVTGDGTATPRIDQLRLAFDHDGYEEHLPAIYRVPQKVVPGAQPDPESLIRFLALFESFFADTEEEIGDLRLLLDPDTAPAEWLGWLSGWLAFAAEEGWPVATARRLLAGAFESYAWRGTARGLRQALAERLGVAATIGEPHAQTDWWVLPPGSEAPSDSTDDCGCGCGGCGGGAEAPPASAGIGARLGLTTRLASAPPEGAVAGVSAVLDGSHLIEAEDFGEPLFTPTAYRFSVRVPSSQVSAPATRAAVEALIEREKPAHTDFELCLVNPGAPLGQRTLGVDALLGGGPPPASRLGESPAGAAPPLLTLDGEPAGRLGGARLGTSARLGTRPEPPARKPDLRNQPAAAGSATAREEESWARS